MHGCLSCYCNHFYRPPHRHVSLLADPTPNHADIHSEPSLDASGSFGLCIQHISFNACLHSGLISYYFYLPLKVSSACECIHVLSCFVCTCMLVWTHMYAHSWLCEHMRVYEWSSEHLCVNMHDVWAYVHVCVSICAYILVWHIYVHICVSACYYMWSFLCMHACIKVCISMHACVSTYMCTCMWTRHLK